MTQSNYILELFPSMEEMAFLYEEESTATALRNDAADSRRHCRSRSRSQSHSFSPNPVDSNSDTGDNRHCLQSERAIVICRRTFHRRCSTTSSGESSFASSGSSTDAFFTDSEEGLDVEDGCSGDFEKHNWDDEWKDSYWDDDDKYYHDVYDDDDDDDDEVCDDDDDGDDFLDDYDYFDDYGDDD